MELDGPLVVMALAGIHISGQHVALLESRVGARLEDAAAGCLLAYAVVDLLPAVANAETDLITGRLGRFPVDDLAWIACLAGMLLFILSQNGGSRRVARRRAIDSSRSSAVVIAAVVHGAANLNAGILLVDHHRDGSAALIPAALLLAVHLALMEREHLQSSADPCQRWERLCLAAALVTGGLIGSIWTPQGAVMAVLRAALAGVLILNGLQNHVGRDKRTVDQSLVFIGCSLGYAVSLGIF